MVNMIMWSPHENITLFGPLVDDEMYTAHVRSVCSGVGSGSLQGRIGQLHDVTRSSRRLTEDGRGYANA